MRLGVATVTGATGSAVPAVAVARALVARRGFRVERVRAGSGGKDKKNEKEAEAAAAVAPVKRQRRAGTPGRRELLSQWNDKFLLLSTLLSARLAARRSLTNAAVAEEAERTWNQLRAELEALEAQMKEPGRSARALAERLDGALGAARASLAAAEQMQAEREEKGKKKKKGAEEEGGEEEEEGHGYRLPIVQLGWTAPMRFPIGELSNAILATRFERQLAHILWTGAREDKD